MSQSNPVAIVTGASRGIGRASALYFAKEGFDVALIARNEKLLNVYPKRLQTRTCASDLHIIFTSNFSKKKLK